MHPDDHATAEVAFQKQKVLKKVAFIRTLGEKKRKEQTLHILYP